MKRIITWLIGAALAMSLTEARAQKATPGAASAAPESALKEQAALIAKEAFSELSSNLLAAITRSGLNEALPYCSDIAIPLTKAVALKNHVGLSRITHKPRNPANQATATEEAILRQFQSNLTAKRPLEPVVFTRTGQPTTLYVPIVINNPLCLMCHGKPDTEISRELQSTIRKRYPRDQATGFALGDLRGAWKVEFAQKGRADERLGK